MFFKYERILLIAFFFNFVLKWDIFSRTLIQDVLGDQARVGAGFDGPLVFEVLDTTVPDENAKYLNFLQDVKLF
jgi:hypothetical protein